MTTSLPAPPPSGLLNLNKPIGVTSRDVVDLVARPLRKVKVGHAGTLDPLATGVLVVCVGAATRLIEYVQRMPKTYRTRIRLGATSNTLDADGEVVETPDPRVPRESEVVDAIATQVGTIDQKPPDFSALKVGGKRAYNLARSGQPVELAPRPVTITRVDLVSYEWPHLDLEIDCGSGTYIRSIARDVGEALGCGGLIEILTRTKIGGFTIETAIDPGRLDRESIVRSLRSPIEAISALPQVILTADQAADIAQGRPIEAGGPHAEGEFALIGPDGGLVAIAEAVDEGRRLAPRRVLAAT
jgi:tRNA pseudouridine55 synthase